MPDPVVLAKKKHHAIITLNRPDKRNPLPYLPEHGLLPALEQLRSDDNVRAVIITGSGKAFCSGMDLEGLKALQHATDEQNRKDSESIHSFFETLRTYPKPLIAALNGPAVGGGAGMARMCDVVIAAETASLRFSEVSIGFVPALVSVYLARQVGESVTRDILLTARKISAEEALRLGMANEVVAATALIPRAEAVAEMIAQNSPQALRRTRELIAKTAELPLLDALDAATRENAEARGTADCQEGIRAFLEKREPGWR